MFNSIVSKVLPYAMAIKVALVAALILYIGYLNWRADNLKNQVTNLETEKTLWAAENKRLANTIIDQSKAVDELAKASSAMQNVGNELLKQARLANGIRQGKIKAAAARIVLDKPSDCDVAIDMAKKDLQK